MARGPYIPPWVGLLIAEVAQAHPKLTALEVLKKITPELRRRETRLPGKSYAEKIIKKARGNDPVDQPWNMGSGLVFHIPAAATADLLAVWRRCMIGGTKLSIRQAIWIARLRGVVSSDTEHQRIEDLYHWGSSYAAYERATEALGMVMDTTHLDSNLALRTPWGTYDP